MQPVFYERPEGDDVVTLRTAPRLANWNRSGDTGQARLTRALSFSDAQIDPRLAACQGPVAVRFDVGLPRSTRLLDERDLDNYLLPLTAYLADRAEHPLVSVWGCKRYAEETTLRIAPARPREADDGRTVVLGTSAVGDRDEFKAGFRQRIHDLAADLKTLPDGPVTLEAAFVVGPNRDWLDLWWSTIDGLGPLLGQSPAEPEGRPRDGRIVDLGLHLSVDPDLGDDVLVGVRAQPGWLDPVPAEASTAT
jgi:hypothetical protein